MGFGTNPDFGQAFAAALEWWRDAGVDAAFVDEPRAWLPPAIPPAQAHPLAPPPGAPPEAAAVALTKPPSLPETLEAFAPWWISTPDLDGGRVSGRVAPRGTASPSLMIVADMPESSDREHLLSGPDGKLLDLFLRAAGLDEGRIYRASALPCHSPATDWTPQANRAAAEALSHHIRLVAPERLLLIGFNVLPLLSHASAQGPAVSSVFNHEGATVPLLAVRKVPAAASQSRWKSVLWRAWLDWTA